MALHILISYLPQLNKLHTMRKNMHALLLVMVLPATMLFAQKKSDAVVVKPSTDSVKAAPKKAPSVEDKTKSSKKSCLY